MSDAPEPRRAGAHSRRGFLVAGAAAAAVALGAPALLRLTRKGAPAIAGGFVDDDSAAGHALRDGTWRPGRAREIRTVPVAIVGGGIGGLSAGWRLDALGVRDWLLLELAPTAGGNARSGVNDTGRFPWGAHYLPLPGPEAGHVRALLRELGVLGDDGTWDERMLCHAPQERLWQHGQFHEGLEPLDALTAAERAQFTRLEALIGEFRATGAFAVPSAAGHARLMQGALPPRAAAVVRALDGMTARAWLDGHGLTSPALRWWVEYGLRDDYGCALDQAGAWAAVHYAAARPAGDEGPLTWPEGNDWIAQRLAARAGDRLVPNAPALRLERDGTGWRVHTPALEVRCQAVVWAAPLFVLPRVLPEVRLPVTLDYAPWVVATLLLRRPPQERGFPAAWDSVIYGSPSLGYVDAGHQGMGTRPDRRTWSWYHAVVGADGRAERQWLRTQRWEDWRDRIVADLARAHPDIAACVERIDVKVWGHAMARPLPGVLARTARLRDWQPAPGVWVGHADASSLSLFEEAQWHGGRAAEGAARRVG
ncbi:MAG: NAD(P)-binding protein [Gemmatimonadetes bacterium]|nr:NAD(P)-binding protein [Gemmatimonadota bacterium]